MRNNIVAWLDETAALYPAKTAMADGEGEYSFSQLRSKALGIARGILDALPGQRGGRPVVVYMEKSRRVPASFLGVAYSGNFYSPIDTDMPEQRINRILAVLQPALVITTAELMPRFAAFDYSGGFLIYEDAPELEKDEAVEAAQERIIDTDLLYVLFTSGSTGTPKGVCISHRAAMDYILWVTEKFSITPEDNLGNQAPFYFDNSIFDIYSCIKTGAAMHIIPKRLFAQPVRLLEFLRDRRISVFLWVPSAMIFVSRLKALRNVDLRGILRCVLFAGEVMPNKQLNVWRSYLPDAVYANMYGPTEIADICTCYVVDRDFSDEEPLPIGRACGNIDILILDGDDKLVTEPEVVGELCVRGTCLSSGYYNAPEKTAEVFVQNPLVSSHEERIYRSGDLVKYNDRGEIMYLSRKDFQIKHMGHRIELGEIETAAASLPRVNSCCALYDELGGKIVLFIDIDYSREEVHGLLAELIPEYMLPNKVVFLRELPLNANGKIDRVELKKLL